MNKSNTIERQGTYRYTLYDPLADEWTRHSARVQILDETARSYRVRFLSRSAGGHGIGSETWVRKKSVSLQRERSVTRVTQESRWLPYMD
ncbi:MAG: hypothetical protein LBP56_00225 [Odoribacteraceae bacterium]|jgi:hypothetical protein|nr:hypothetical protein [Odoribacteraceae bacterium]